MSEPRRTYTIDEAAQKLRIGRNTAYAAAQRGEILTIKIGKRLIVPGEFLDRLVAGPTLEPPVISARSGPRESAPKGSAPQGERVARQQLQRLMAKAIGEAEGDQESALAQFVDELFQRDDGAHLIWSLLSRGRADALNRLFEKVNDAPPAPNARRNRDPTQTIGVPAE